MAKTLIAVFVMLSMLLLVIEQSNADCCPPYNEHNCADGTAITPCCGRGRCNIFCCNCDGGCRKATIRTSRERFLNRIAKSSVTKLDVHISINKLGDCQPDWYNQCQSNEECCSGNCYKGPDGTWAEGLCKPKEVSGVSDCQPDWFNQCQSNEECCSGNCYKGPDGTWAEGLCKPKE